MLGRVIFGRHKTRPYTRGSPDGLQRHVPAPVYGMPHTRTLPSSLPEASWVPSGDQDTLNTTPVCPSRVRSRLPVAAAHTCTVLSALPEAS